MSITKDLVIFNLEGYPKVKEAAKIIYENFMELSEKVKKYEEQYHEGEQKLCKEEPDFVHMAINDTIMGVVRCIDKLNGRFSCNECPYLDRHYGFYGCRTCLFMDILYYLHGYRRVSETIKDNVIFDPDEGA